MRPYGDNPGIMRKLSTGYPQHYAVPLHDRYESCPIMSVSGLCDTGPRAYHGPMSSHETAPRVGDTLTTSASALVGIVREVVAHDTTPDLFRVRITVDSGTPDEFDKWTMVRIGHKGANRA
jgi:hypothetical protein